MLYLRNSTIHFDLQRCCQCGVCLAVCPVGALASKTTKNGLFSVVRDTEKCTNCMACVNVCPAEYTTQVRFSVENLNACSGIYLGHAKNKPVRWMASSGGVARSLISVVLESQFVDAVYSLIYPNPPFSMAMPDDPKSESVACSREEINAICRAVEPTGVEVEGRWLLESPAKESIPCSIYRPIAWGEHLSEFSRNWRRVLVIGLPCQIKAAKTYFNDAFPELDVLTVCLMCRQQKTIGFTRFVKKLAGCSKVSDQVVQYRGGGWPGSAGGGKHTVSHSVSGIAFDPWRPLWRMPGCRTCGDCCGMENSDITLADAWNLLSPAVDPVGTNLIFSWTDNGNNLLKATASVVSLSEATVDEAIESVERNSINEKNRNQIPFFLGVNVTPDQESQMQQKLQRWIRFERCLLIAPRFFMWMHNTVVSLRKCLHRIYRVRWFISSLTRYMVKELYNRLVRKQ